MHEQLLGGLGVCCPALAVHSVPTVARSRDRAELFCRGPCLFPSSAALEEEAPAQPGYFSLSSDSAPVGSFQPCAGYSHTTRRGGHSEEGQEHPCSGRPHPPQSLTLAIQYTQWSTNGLLMQKTMVIYKWSTTWARASKGEQRGAGP